jgi:hypothetical protein
MKLSRNKIIATISGVAVLAIIAGITLNARHNHAVAVREAAAAVAVTKHKRAVAAHLKAVAATEAAVKAAAWAASDNNPATLATSVQYTFNTDMADPTNASYDPGVQVSSVSCIPDSGANTQTCLLSYSDNSANMDITVTVSADGQNWISH